MYLTAEEGHAYLFPTFDDCLSCSTDTLLQYQVSVAKSAWPTPFFEQVHAGGTHFVVQTSHAQYPLYVYGDNRFGQLGTLSLTDSQCLHPLTFFSQEEGFPGIEG